MIDAIWAVVHIVKTGFLEFIIKWEILVAISFLRQGGGLLKAFLKHLISPDRIQKMKFMHNFMDKGFSFHGDVLINGIAEYGCDLIPAW